MDVYRDHVEDYDALLFILSLLPDSCLYVFARNLLKYDEFLVDGDVYEGVALVGIIRIVGDCIVLDVGERVIVLLELPPAYDV